MKNIIVITILSLLMPTIAFAQLLERTFDLAGPSANVSVNGVPGNYLINITNFAPGNSQLYSFETKVEILKYDNLTPVSETKLPGWAAKKKSTSPNAGDMNSRVDQNVVCKLVSEKLDELSNETNEAKVSNLISEVEGGGGCSAIAKKADHLIDRTNDIVELPIKKGTKVTVTVKRAGPSPKSWTYSIRSELPGKFVANWGLAILPNNDKSYFTRGNDEGTFEINEKNGGGAKVIPAVFYTYVPEFSESKLNNIGFSLGLGLDQEDLSAFAGFNWTHRSNLGFTGGVALHKQERLLGEYEKGQILAEGIESLTEDSFQLNLFVALVYGF